MNTPYGQAPAPHVPPHIPPYINYWQIGGGGSGPMTGLVNDVGHGPRYAYLHQSRPYGAFVPPGARSGTGAYRSFSQYDPKDYGGFAFVGASLSPLCAAAAGLLLLGLLAK